MTNQNFLHMNEIESSLRPHRNKGVVVPIQLSVSFQDYTLVTLKANQQLEDWHK